MSAKTELRPSKIVCVGKNYAKHAAEMGGEVPEEPLLFLKAPSALIGDGEEIVMPKWAGRVDYEGEIAVVIGRRATRIDAADGWSYVRGILPLNDVTARDLQASDNQWSRAKGFDTFCPVGDVVPVDEVDLDALSVTTRVNGEVRQQGEVGDMVFKVPDVLAHITRAMTLEPGDIVATGTPDGIGPLQPGDRVEVEVGGVGTVSNPVVEADQ
ncbi:MAG: fumarylacetoacetate hydrolase family protein [Gemmatimonadota bacterium]|nr:fumarylacetoacetate hydrolase family protein [Gemmatimonadota bacterium]